MSSSNNGPNDFSDVDLFSVFQQLQEDKDRFKKLKRLTKSFKEADNEKTRIIQVLQDKPFLNYYEQEYLNYLRIQCMKDFENHYECQQLTTKVAEQIEEKQQFFRKFNSSTLWTNTEIKYFTTNNPHLFAIKVSHNGNIRYVDWVQVAQFSISQMDEMMYKIGYINVGHLFYQFRVPGMSMDDGLRQLSNDEDVALLIQHVINLSNKVIEIYVSS